jgi:hypothetical protein
MGGRHSTDHQVTLPHVKTVGRRAWLRAAAALAVALGVSVLGVAAPAQAETARCPVNWSPVNGDGYVTAYQDTPVRVGPYGECSSVGTVKKGTIFYLWCGTTNDYSNNWWYGRIAGTSVQGWVYQPPLFGPVANIKDDSNDGQLNIEGCGPRFIYP